MNKDMRFAFFGTGEIARYVLDELKAAGFLPALVITSPAAPKGRGLAPSPSAVFEWAHDHAVPTLEPTRIDEGAISALQKSEWDVYIVADYGYLIPQAVLDIPRRGTLNMHPSLLPRLRGPSPIRSAILNDERTTGATVILLDDKMDHGPIVAQRKIAIHEWPPHASALEEALARGGGKLLADILPHWVAGDIDAQPQNHDIATYTKKFAKQDGLLDLAADGNANLLKIRAYEGWPGTHAFFERAGKKIRVGIVGAHLIQQNDLLGERNGKLIIDLVKPEGKREMPYEEFLRSGAQPA